MTSNPYLIPINKPRPQHQQQQQPQPTVKRAEARVLMVSGAGESENDNTAFRPTTMYPRRPSIDRTNTNNPTVTSRGRSGSRETMDNRSSAAAPSRSQPMFPSSAAAAAAVHRNMQQQHQQLLLQQQQQQHPTTAAVLPTQRNSCEDALLHHMIRKEVDACEEAARNGATAQLHAEQGLSPADSNNDDIPPPAPEDASRRLAFLMQSQQEDLRAMREVKQQQDAVDQIGAARGSGRGESPSPRVPGRSNSRGAATLPSTFVPVPPVRWRLPPQLPARKRLVADGPRLALLETLEDLAAETAAADKKQQQQGGGFARRGGGGVLITTGKRITSELWVAIFEYLDPRELCRCSEVSRLWLCIARSEFLWSPILSNVFSGLIHESESEERFEARIHSIQTAGGEDGGSGSGGGLAPAPSRQQQHQRGQEEEEEEEKEEGTDQQQSGEINYLCMCPSLERISNFVSHHRGRIRGQLREAESRVHATQNRIEQQQQQQQQQQQARQTTTTGAGGGGSRNGDVSALEVTVTNERNVLLRRLEGLEPKIAEMLSRLREAESNHVQHSRSLNEAIVAAKRSSLQLDAVGRKALASERRAKDAAALDDLERRICQLVLGCAPQLPASLSKSVRCFSQLELILLSCCADGGGGGGGGSSLAELPHRWSKVKKLVSFDALSQLRQDVERSNDPRGVLEGKLQAAAASSSSSSAAAGGTASTSTAARAPPLRFSDALFGTGASSSSSSSSNRAPRVDRHRSSATEPVVQTQQPSVNLHDESSSSTMMTKQKIIAEMCNMDDEALQKFLF